MTKIIFIGQAALIAPKSMTMSLVIASIVRYYSVHEAGIS